MSSGAGPSTKEKQVNMRKVISIIVAGALAVAGLIGVTAVTTPASADPCTGVWSIGVGGFTLAGPGITGQDSGYLNVNQRVGYNSADPIGSGVGELNRLVLQHRADCPTDHIMLLGHSGGALVVHRWVSAAQDFPNLNAVLLADPARAAGPGGPGFSDAELGWLGGGLKGTDANFGSIPTYEVCHPADHICNSASDWFGYATGVHTAYDYNAWDYSTDGTGQDFS